MFYVYTHVMNGHIVYVGKGNMARAVYWSDRQDAHKAYMKSHLETGDFSFVEIAYTDLTAEEAFGFEQALLMIHRPVFNSKRSYTQPKTDKPVFNAKTDPRLKKGGRPKGAKDKTKRQAGSGRPKQVCC